MALIAYPSSLPPPNLSGYQLAPGQPFVRGAIGNGRAGQRRGFTSQPMMVAAQFDFSVGEFMLFEGWYYHLINDGADWFLGPAKRAGGLVQLEMRFVGAYNSTLLGPQQWRTQAQLEIRTWR